jgi:hypothetical protein
MKWFIYLYSTILMKLKVGAFCGRRNGRSTSSKKNRKGNERNKSRSEFFPIGEPNFRNIINSRQFFLDKSLFIKDFEESVNHIIFLRPPKWGKSLLLSIFQYYDDLNTTPNDFGYLYSGLNN